MSVSHAVTELIYTMYVNTIVGILYDLPRKKMGL